MKTFTLKLPTLAFIAGTRAALGLGAGLLLSGKIPQRRRRTLGLTLLGIGAAATIPAFKAVTAGMKRNRSATRWHPTSDYIEQGQSFR